MKILLVSATIQEIKPLLGRLKKVQGNPNLWSGKLGKNRVDALVTGVGMTATAFHLAKALHVKYDFAIQAGFAGSFRRDISLGALVQVTTDIFSDLGAEDGEEFLSLEEIGLGKSPGLSERSPSDKSQVTNSKSKVKSRDILLGLRKVKGITVNTVHGNLSSIKKVVKKFDPDVESMEGAAFFMACDHFKIPRLQIRAISNYVEKRNKKNWKPELAVRNLNPFVCRLLIFV